MDSPIEENKMLRRILNDAKIGWWKANLTKKTYIVSDYIKNLIGIKSNSIGFEDMLDMVREDYKLRISKEIENIFNQYDQLFPILCPTGEVWIRSKIVYRETDDDNTPIITGFIQEIPNPEITQPDKAFILRINNLLYQLNSISHTLLSFPKSRNPESVISRILKEILKQFKGGRAYIIEYDLNNKTQTCTYEVTDKGIEAEQERLIQIPISEFPWWTQQIQSGNSVILSRLSELPEEAIQEKRFLELQQIKSIIIEPLISRNGIWGYVGIDIVEEYHNWSNEDCQWFSSLANIINICLTLYKSEQEALLDKTYLENLYRHMPLGYVRARIIYDKDQNPIDYIFVDVNDVAGKMISKILKNYIGAKASDLGLDVKKQLVNLIKALDSDYYIEHTYHLKYNNEKKYYHSILYSIQHDEVICLFTDTTEARSTHEALDRSERILRNIYNNLPAGIELYDKEGTLIDLNKKNLEIFGIDKKEDVLGLNIFENPNIPKDVIQKMKNKEEVSFRLDYSFKDISNYYPSRKKGCLEIYTTASMLYDTKGDLIHYLLINLDNTEISQAYSKIAEFETSFSIVSQFGKIGYCKFDLYTKTGYGIPQWYHNLGEKETTPLSEIIGVYKHIDKEDKEYILECIKKVKAGEINSFSRDVRVNAQTENKWTRINVIQNTRNTDPTKLEMICVNYDVTELKETEHKLIEAKNKAEVSDRLKSAFLANMSHEIRTPLNAIVGFSNLLVDTEDKNEREEYIDIVQENNELLLQLISDILDLSKIEAGSFEFVIGQIDVQHLCRDIIRSFQVKMQNNPVKLIFDEDSPKYYISSDKNRLTQVITNFINNALKFTTNGYIKLGYNLINEKEIKIYVKDTGRGIPKENIGSIFDRFVKLNPFVQGSGLGLPICKSLVEQMGGEIGVESDEREGSCFWFTHPLSQETDNTVTNISPEEPAHNLANNRNSYPTILVAEDTESNYLLISTILKKEYILIRARNGVEAIKLFEQMNPDIILMDIKMPEMNGIEATRIIRKSNQTVPIIAITAFAFDQDKQRALDAGCTDYIAKPIHAETLKKRLIELINQ